MDQLLTNEITYDAVTVTYNLLLSCILGIIISTIYKITHKGLSYSQSFMLTIVFVTVVVCMVMMVIGNNLARAFALVGALSIIRFRTVIKDTKDTSYVFFGLAAGMAAGTSSYFLAIIGVIIISLLSIFLYKTNYGSIYKSEIILRFRADTNIKSAIYNKILNKYAISSSILHIEPSSEKKSSNIITFDLILKKNIHLENLSSDLQKVKGLSEIKLIASKTDVDY
jgi:uncharacterized membrane protein YhiD involved in acid resistance|tara:strand:+ start:662 stop:1336 length:675 start_codon:yes stop_codon:yes gene_type:complete